MINLSSTLMIFVCGKLEYEFISRLLRSETKTRPISTRELFNSNQHVTKRKRTFSSMQEKMESFLESASASINKLSESKTSSTSQLFESLATKINEANLTTSEIYEVESAVCSLVYSKLAECGHNNN